ncbi:MAG: dipeptide epimerase [Clostridiales bacterium]|nr:dipeptide epimerase [Clostridiales bacterium]
MRISGIDVYYFDIPLEQPFKIAIGTVHEANNVLVRVQTDEGITGLGESCPFAPITGETQETNIAVARNLRDMLIGKDPLAIEPFLGLTGGLLHSNPSIVAAFDMALYDILGKVASLPLFRLLGGEPRSLETDITAGLDTPEKMAARAKEFIAQGYRKIKIKVGQDPELDIARLEAIREAIGGTPAISIDANQGWTVPQALAALKGMEKFRILFVEQPVVSWDTDGLRAVRQNSPIPVMADEALFSPQDAIKLIKADACDYFNIKLMKAGGIANSLKIGHIAESANIRAMVGCMLETRLALTAAAHLMAARKNIIFADLDGNASHTVDPVVGGMEVKGGAITLPESPGLGVDIDPAFLKKLRRV